MLQPGAAPVVKILDKIQFIGYIIDVKSSLYNQVYPIARSVRAWAQSICHLYETDSDLGGMCAIASAKLHRELRAIGIQSRLVLGSGHCFVMVDKWVVDVTATQFHSAVINDSLPEILIEERQVIMDTYFRPDDNWSRKFYSIEMVTTSIVDLRAELQDQEWPDSQMIPLELAS